MPEDVYSRQDWCGCLRVVSSANQINILIFTNGMSRLCISIIELALYVYVCMYFRWNLFYVGVPYYPLFLWMNRTLGGSGLKWTFFSGCMLSVQYCVSWLGGKQWGPTVGHAEWPHDSLGTRTSNHIAVWVCYNGSVWVWICASSYNNGCNGITWQQTMGEDATRHNSAIDAAQRLKFLRASL